MGFATGMLAATIAVGGFIGVPAMMYLLGVPGLMASATELVIAFVMGLGGTVKYAWSGFVDIRLAMIILAGSLFGIQLGAIGTTYVKPYMVKVVMGVIMILVLFSRGVAIPVYLSDLDLISRMTPEAATLLKNTSFGMMIFALLVGAFIVLKALIKGMLEHRAELASEHFSQAVTATPRAAMKRMLLVVDGSKFSEGAIRESIRMAKKCGSKLHIMTVVPDNLMHDGLGENLQAEEQAKAQARLAAVEERAQAAGVECETLMAQSEDAFQAIVNEAERGLMDLIIMGRRDRSDLSRALLGSTAAKVIGHTSCNVLVVPREASFEGKGILVAVDGSRHAEAAASVVAGMMQLCKAPVTAISAAIDARLNDDAKATVSRAQQWLEGVGVKANVEVRVGAPDTVITSAAKEGKADLIVMGSRGLSGLDRLLLGSVSERVIGQAECPVLVVRG
jgi:nucleotide-binding universal stress UspA family protein